jgi:hypothetical protein
VNFYKDEEMEKLSVKIIHDLVEVKETIESLEGKLGI